MTNVYLESNMEE